LLHPGGGSACAMSSPRVMACSELEAADALPTLLGSCRLTPPPLSASPSAKLRREEACCATPPRGRLRSAPAALELSEDVPTPSAAPSPAVHVKRTFIDRPAPRSPSLEAFYRERVVQTCPSKAVGRLLGLGLEHLAGAAAGRTFDTPLASPRNIQTPRNISTPSGDDFLDCCHSMCMPAHQAMLFPAAVVQTQPAVGYLDGGDGSDYAYYGEPYGANWGPMYYSAPPLPLQVPSVYSLEAACVGRPPACWPFSSAASSSSAAPLRPPSGHLGRPRPVLNLDAMLAGAACHEPSPPVQRGAVIVAVLEPAESILASGLLRTFSASPMPARCLETLPQYAAPELDTEAAVVKLGLLNSLAASAPPPPPPPLGPALGFEEDSEAAQDA